MDLLTNKFRQTLEWLSQQDADHQMGDKPVAYLTFEVEHIPEVKRLVPQWEKVAAHAGFEVEVLSVAKVLLDFFRNNPNRESWFEFDQVQEKWELEELFKDLGSNVKNNQVVEKAILEAQGRLKGRPKALLIIADLETLHPFSRFGPIEQSIYHQIELPIIVLYPGKKSGSALKFLGFYPEDGNYRSKHF
jgi:hypothetical protein